MNERITPLQGHAAWGQGKYPHSLPRRREQIRQKPQLLLAPAGWCSPAREPEQSQEQILKAGGASSRWPPSGLLPESSVLCIRNHMMSITAFCEQAHVRLRIANEYPAICHRSAVSMWHSKWGRGFRDTPGSGKSGGVSWAATGLNDQAAVCRDVLSARCGRGLCPGYPFLSWKEQVVRLSKSSWRKPSLYCFL